jgi:hypothetical protein
LNSIGASRAADSRALSEQNSGNSENGAHFAFGAKLRRAKFCAAAFANDESRTQFSTLGRANPVMKSLGAVDRPPTLNASAK